MPPFDKHLFICCNTREPGHPRGSCNPTGSDALQKAFKKALALRGVKRVRANKSGCLDQCEHGPNMVIYPEAVWYGGVRKEDLDEIVESHIIGGEPVRRLMIAEDCLNAVTCPHKPRKTVASGQ